jgi:hypothetical protein
MEKFKNGNTGNNDKELKGVFKKSFDDIKMKDNLKDKLISIKDIAKPMTPFERFLETEIVIPTASLIAAATIVLVAGGVFLNSLILPGEIPEPKYQVIEMKPTAMIQNGNDNV